MFEFFKLSYGHNLGWDLAGSYWFYGTVSQNFVGSANQQALLFIILVPLIETEPAENITLLFAYFKFT